MSDNAKLRVANIIEEGKLGGPQIRIANVAKALMPEVETTVLLPFENSDRFCALLKKHHIPYKTFHISRITKDPWVAARYIFFSWYEIMQLARYFRKERFDLIHVSGGSWQYKGVYAGKLARTKVVWHLNDTYAPLFIRRFFSLCSGLPDAYIFASNRSRDFYQPFLKKNKLKFIIPAPVETRLFSPEISLSNFKEGMYKYRDKIVIGTVANVSPIKDLETFIKTASILNMKFDNLHFIVIGSIFKTQRSYYAKLKALCNDLSVTNLEFIGQKMDIRPFLSAFDIYVCSSKAESSPISVWEALSMGKPVVSTDVGDVALYVSDNINGFIVRVGDASSLSDRIGYLIRHREKRLEFGRRSRQIACKKLDINSCVKLCLEAYTRVVHGGVKSINRKERRP